MYLHTFYLHRGYLLLTRTYLVKLNAYKVQGYQKVKKFGSAAGSKGWAESAPQVGKVLTDLPKIGGANGNLGSGVSISIMSQYL